MADTPKKEEKTEETKPADTTSVGLETTTANDGSIAINQDDTASADSNAEVPAKPKSETVPVVSTPSTSVPVIVSDADVEAAQKENDPHQSLAEQIEVLTGEVQALEAKIEKLTGGIGEAPTTPPIEPASPVPTQPLVAPMELPVEKVEEKNEELKVDDKSADLTPIPPTPPVGMGDTNISKPAPPASPVDDIYSKILTNPNNVPSPTPTHKDLNDDTTIDEGSSGIGTIGEVLIVFGLISLVILGVSPFFKSMIGGNWEALKSIGWPTATISLVLGFLLFLFNKGRLVFKILALILTLIAAVMTAAVFDYGSMLGPLSSWLDPIASFYK